MKTKLFFMLLLSFFTLSVFADQLINLSTDQLIAMQKNNNALVIDIRTEKEWATTGTIPDSHKLQFFSPKGKFNTKEWLANLDQLKSSPDQPVILVCRSGNRSGRAGNILTKQMGMKNIYHLSNGMQSWVKAGNQTTKNCLPNIACK
ncbi:MAG: rhodanese-like domain-containing protein [Methylococcales bacterium]|nr:rhodanese-like domain-containing protein [Methylococcales bacterium]